MRSIVSLLFCALIALSTVSAAEDTIRIQLFFGSTANRIVISVKNEAGNTIAVQMQDSSASAQWVPMIKDSSFWVVLSEEPFVFPLSFSLISANLRHVLVDNIIDSIDSIDAVDTGMQYTTPQVSSTDGKSNALRRHRPLSLKSAPCVPCGKAPTTTTKAPTTTSTKTPTTTTTRAPATTTTTKAPAKAPTTTTRAPTTTTRAPTTTTRAPTTTTRAPTTTTTTKAPSTSSGGMKLMVALYTYPGATWTTVAQNGKTVKTVAIINPNSGPGNGPDGNYKTYMNTLNNAGVEMIGYVHTSYGARSISLVKADISKYAQEFPLVVGIFIDEASNSASQVSYYTQVHNHIMSMPGFKYNVLNPGTAPVEAYLSISTQIVSFENAASQFSGSSTAKYQTAANKDHFSMIAHSGSASDMRAAITAAKNKGNYGWVYVTSGAATGGTYNSLPSYYEEQAKLVASLN